jgi:hypothetical protein
MGMKMNSTIKGDEQENPTANAAKNSRPEADKPILGLQAPLRMQKQKSVQSLRKRRRHSGWDSPCSV